MNRRRGKPLPADMQAHLETISPAQRRQSIASTLRSLLECVEAQGFDAVRFDQETIAAFVIGLERRGAARNSINSALTGLRTYARAAGLAFSWRHPGKHRIDVRLEDLPETMRAALSDMETGRRHSLGSVPKERLRKVGTVLRTLVEAIREANAARPDDVEPLPEELNAETAAVLEDALRARGAEASSIENYKTHLRTYARYAKEGLDWAVDSRGVDRRDIHEVLEARHWRPYRERAIQLSREGTRAADIKLVDGFLKLPRRNGLVSEQDVLAFAEESPKRALTLRITFGKLAPTHPDMIALRTVAMRLQPPQDRQPGSENRGRPRSVSVAPEDLPDSMRCWLADMRAQSDHAGPRYSREIMRGIENALTQLVFSARRRGLTEEICQETLIAWIDDMEERGCTNSSIKSSMHFALFYAERANLDPEIVEMIRGDRSRYSEWALEDDTRRTKRREQMPVALSDIAHAVYSWRKKAEAVTGEAHDDAWRRMWVGVALLALLTFRPLRVKDLLRLKVGISAIREANTWHIDIITSKMNKRINKTLSPRLTKFIDHAILQGMICQNEGQFWELYHRREGSALFARPDGKPFSHAWVYLLCVEAYGHGPHEARSLSYDRMAKHGEKGRRIAQDNVGHISAESVQHYKETSDSIQMDIADQMLAEEQGNDL